MHVGIEGKFEAFALDDADSRSWAFFPIAAKRVADFCKKYDSDADIPMMVTQLKMAFVHPRPSADLILVLENGIAVGHALVAIEEWFGTRMATVIQIESDKKIPQALNQQIMAHIEQWATDREAKFMQAMARNSTLARVFKAFYGYKDRSVMLRKPLPTGVAQSKTVM